MEIQTAEIVKIHPTEVWYEKDIMGTVHIKMQHKGMHAHTLVKIHYDYAYTSNSHQYELTKKIGTLLGIDDIEQRNWEIPEEWKKK
jgi:hypothetical protein